MIRTEMYRTEERNCKAINCCTLFLHSDLLVPMVDKPTNGDTHTQDTARCTHTHTHTDTGCVTSTTLKISLNQTS